MKKKPATKISRNRAKWVEARENPKPPSNKGGKKSAGTFYYDLETTDWDKPLAAVVMDAEGHTTRFTGPECVAAVAEMQRRVGGTWWAHAGGIFDHLLCWRHGQLPADLILTGSSVLKATGLAVRGRPSLVYRDSYPRWLASLAKVGKAVGLPKLEAPRGALETIPLEETLRYCERDVEILKRGTEETDAFLAKHGVKANTSGSAAVKLLEALDPGTWAQMARPDCEVSPDVACGVEGDPGEDHHGDGPLPGALEAVRGGRVEVRRIGVVKGPIYVYDLHSSYPSQYGKAPMPIGCERTESKDLHAKLPWVDMVTWQEHTDPDRTAFELGQYGTGQGFQCAWLTSEQALDLEKRNMRPQRVGVGFTAVAVVSDFAAEFVRRLYAAKEGGGSEAFFSKVTLNSLHGRFGINVQKWRHVLRAENRPDAILPPGTDFVRLYEAHAQLVKVDPSQQPLTAAFVLARARQTLARAIERVEREGFLFYYCDTDSLHTNAPPDMLARILPGQVGPDLGQWGHEFTAEEACYLGPKLYALRAETKVKKAAKGFPSKLALLPDGTAEESRGADDQSWAVFLEAAERELKIARGGLAKAKQGSAMGQKQTLTRTMRATYTGRHLHPDGRLTYLPADF